MLAIQRPRMGSSQPFDGNGPFRNSHNPDESLFLEPPEPAPGEPLLSFEDDQALSNFFNQITSNQYSDVSFGEGLNFSDAWNGLPPQFMGMRTSYGPQLSEPMSSSILDFSNANFQDLFSLGSNSMPSPHLPPPPPQRAAPQPPLHSPIDQGPSADAAAVLTSLQNGHNPRMASMGHSHTLSSSSMAPPPVPLRTRQRSHAKAEGKSPPQPASATSPSIPTSPSTQRDERLFTDMLLGNPHGGRPRPTQNPEDVRWGSDTSFGEGFTPTSDRDTHEALESKRIDYIDFLKINSNGTGTEPPNPLHNGEASTANGHSNKESDGPPKKRRKSKIKEEFEDEEEDSTSATATSVRKRKSKAELSGADDGSSTSGNAGKRRKSSVNAGSKASRENLTEEQKRQNHILSEQRRRTLIKEGFEDLQEMVPNLKSGGYSKSAMLQIAGEWLDELIQGNVKLSS